MSKRLNVSITAVSKSVERGEELAKMNQENIFSSHRLILQKEGVDNGKAHQRFFSAQISSMAA
jgi:hypothetical protein